MCRFFSEWETMPCTLTPTGESSSNLSILRQSGSIKTLGTACRRSSGGGDPTMATAWQIGFWRMKYTLPVIAISCNINRKNDEKPWYLDLLGCRFSLNEDVSGSIADDDLKPGVQARHRRKVDQLQFLPQISQIHEGVLGVLSISQPWTWRFPYDCSLCPPKKDAHMKPGL